MKTYLEQGRKKCSIVIRQASLFLQAVRRLLREQLNKNIYTRILFTIVTVFIFCLIAVTMFSGFVLKQITYEQAKQDMLRKAKRVNFALIQQKDQTERVPASKYEEQKDLLKFLSDSFDARIMVFDRQGVILNTSAEQEVVPGSEVDKKFAEIVSRGETSVISKSDSDTGEQTIIAVVPMGNNKDTTAYGILLESKPANLDLALNKMRLYLLMGGIVLLAVIIFISVHLAMHISRPILSLANTMAEISEGKGVFPAEDQSLEEINVLTGQLKRLAVKLQKIQAESCRVEEERARLFAEISHELRTPLTAVQGFVEAIRDGIVQDEVLKEKYLNTIYTQTVHITRLVDDILVLSRLESGNVTVEKLPLDLNALAQGVAMSMEGLAHSRSTAIVIEKKTENALVIGDVDRMEQIIRNLLKNAIMATEKGTIRVGVEMRQDEVVLNIKDNGVGISPDDLPHIWDRFYKAKNQRGYSIEEKGSGLGLVIVKKLVQLQGGKIAVASKLGKGTVFTISFPSISNNS